MKIAARCVAGEECGMRQGKPGGVVKGDQVGPGHLQFLEHQKQVRFQQPHNQGFHQLFLSVSAPSKAHLTVFLFLCGSARGGLRALEGRLANSKSPSRVRAGDKAVAGRNGEEKLIPSEDN